MHKQNFPYNFLDLNQEFIKHFTKVLFMIEIKGIHFCHQCVFSKFSCLRTKLTRHCDQFEVKSYIKTQVGFYFNNKE